MKSGWSQIVKADPRTKGSAPPAAADDTAAKQPVPPAKAEAKPDSRDAAATTSAPSKSEASEVAAKPAEAKPKQQPVAHGAEAAKPAAPRPAAQPDAKPQPQEKAAAQMSTPAQQAKEGGDNAVKPAEVSFSGLFCLMSPCSPALFGAC